MILLILNLVLLALVGVLALLLLGALRQISVINARLAIGARPYVSNHGLEVGSKAPPFSTRSVAPSRTWQFVPDTAGPTVLLFVHPTCSTCRQLLADMPANIQEYQLILITNAAETVAVEWARTESLRGLLLDEQNAIATAYRAEGITPFAVAIVDGSVKAKGVANYWDEMTAMMRHALGVHDHEGARRVTQLSEGIDMEAVK